MNKKVLLIISSVVLIVSISGFAYWRNITSPEYSLLQIKTALKEHDLDKFEKHVDIEGAVSRLIDSLLEFEEKPDSQKTEMEKADENFSRELFKEMKPDLTEEFQQHIKKFVETGDIKSLSKNGDFALGNINNKVRMDFIESISNVKTEGKLSTITLNLNHKRYNQVVPVQVRMRKKDNYWQVSEISNLHEILNIIDDLENKKIAELNKEVYKEMNESFQVSDCLKNEGTIYDSMNYFSDSMLDGVYISCNFFNRKDKEISDFLATINISNKAGKSLASLSVNEDKVIGAEEIKPFYWTMEIPQRSTTRELYDALSDDLNFTFKIESITFNDGKVLKPYEKYDVIQDQV